ncbi:MAG: type I 3-dehydroquinate dehydratase [Sedimentisphaerales bacterium]|nr:type I 3-dehydroquinate dehydratase [Sedimentisphaerales bacterium]
MTYLTVPISAKDLNEAQEQIKAAIAAGAEMLEFRLDYLEGLSVEAARKLIGDYKDTKLKQLPVIVTCRDARQGGMINYPVKLRIEVLTAAMLAGANCIDFEYDNFLITDRQEKIRLALSRNSKARLILSAHNFETRFSDIGKLYRAISLICPGTIPKLVYTANHINDCFDAFDLLHKTSGERIVFCMGNAGIISRILAKKLGSFVTFACTDKEQATAPGQIHIDDLKKLYRYDYIQPDTELFGVIADPVAHSLSPAIHNACFADMNMNRLYLPLLVKGQKQQFESFMNGIILRKWLNFHGFSVTIPHKQNALDYAKAHEGFIEPLVNKIGAVNTLIIRMDGKVKAYNTDYTGAMDAITNELKFTKSDFKELPVAVIGAGGVSRAIVAGLSDAGAKIKIYNRTVEKAKQLALEFNCEYASLDELSGMDAKLLVNCTSIGMFTQAKNKNDFNAVQSQKETWEEITQVENEHSNVEQSPVPKEYLKSTIAVFDTVYNPAETVLLKDAKAKRAKRIDGVSMFVNQAAAQFKLFTGMDADPKLMRKTIIDCLKNE